MGPECVASLDDLAIHEAIAIRVLIGRPVVRRATAAIVLAVVIILEDEIRELV